MLNYCFTIVFRTKTDQIRNIGIQIRNLYTICPYNKGEIYGVIKEYPVTGILVGKTGIGITDVPVEVRNFAVSTETKI
jgi:hypothetical protein